MSSVKCQGQAFRIRITNWQPLGWIWLTNWFCWVYTTLSVLNLNPLATYSLLICPATSIPPCFTFSLSIREPGWLPASFDWTALLYSLVNYSCLACIGFQLINQFIKWIKYLLSPFCVGFCAWCWGRDYKQQVCTFREFITGRKDNTQTNICLNKQENIG